MMDHGVSTVRSNVIEGISLCVKVVRGGGLWSDAEVVWVFKSPVILVTNPNQFYGHYIQVS
jgi:hypothetical protein